MQVVLDEKTKNSSTFFTLKIIIKQVFIRGFLTLNSCKFESY